MSFYKLPDNYDDDLSEFENMIKNFINGEITKDYLKAYRVPFGIYEQRKSDTYMARIRCPGGAITPRQLAFVARMAIKYGNGKLRITTRQELQIHNLTIEKVVPLLKELKDVGLSSRGGGGNTVRNIMGSYNSGVAEDEVFDITPYVMAVTNKLISRKDSWMLPRKYKISFASSEKEHANVFFQDIGLLAVLKDGRKGFRVYIAGGMGRKPQVANCVYDFIPAENAYIIIEAVKQLFHKFGNRRNKHTARLRFLWNNLGRDKFIELLETEIEKLQKSDANFLFGAIPDMPISLPVPHAIKLKPEIVPPEKKEEFELWKRRFVKTQKQKGYYYVIIPVRIGDIEAENAISLADIVANFGEDTLRFTMSQNVALRHIPEKVSSLNMVKNNFFWLN